MSTALRLATSKPISPDTEPVIRGSAPLAPLLEQGQWVVWKWEVKDGNLTKPPYRASDPSQFAKSNDRATWETFETAVANVDRAAGIGFMLSEGVICAFDLDDCRNPESGAVAPWAIELMDRCKSYVEMTPSGTGFRIIGYGKGESVHRKIRMHLQLEGLSKEGTLEIHRKAPRYITITGNAFEGYNNELINIDAVIDRFKNADAAVVPFALENMPDKLRNIITLGRYEDYGGDRSAAVFACACWLVRERIGIDDGANVLLNPAYKISEHCLEQGQTAKAHHSYAIRQMRSAHKKVKKATKKTSKDWTPVGGVRLEDFVAYMPSHLYIFIPTREMWPASSVNARISVDKSHEFLDQNSPVDQMTWAPGFPLLIPNRLVSAGGWIEKEGVTCFNLYRPPVIAMGDANDVDVWLAHGRKIYPETVDHIVKYLAYKVQHPEIKINHGLVLGGEPGIGKDTFLEPVKYAIGHWNFSEPSPTQVMGRFHPFVKAVIMRVSEAHDLGEVDRFALHEHMKTLMASPPDVLLVDEKNLRERYVPNICGVIITTNYRTEALYLPPNDRRHHVSWSNVFIITNVAVHVPGPTFSRRVEGRGLGSDSLPCALGDDTKTPGPRR